MPTDPKWRTIARHAKQPLSLVQAVYLHLLVDASRNVTRGHVDVTPEDLASALDVTEDEIQAVLTAMEGRVLSAGELSGWGKRQPKREDAGDDETGAKSSSERKKAQREREREMAEALDGHAMSRDVTTDKDKEEDKESKEANASLSTAALPDCPHVEILELFAKQLPALPQPRAELWDGQRARNLSARWKWVLTAKKSNGTRYAETRQQALQFFGRFFGYVATCPHLVGENSRGWTADLGWLVKAENFTKVLQGNYQTKDSE